MGAKLLTVIPQHNEAQPAEHPGFVERDLDQMKGSFLASLNHEIRTPLSGALGMLDLLLETSLDEEQIDYVQTARECAHQLLGTLNSILEYSSISAGKLQLHQEEFHLRQVLESIADDFRPRAEGKNLQLESFLDPALPETAIGDAQHLRLALSHILDNAIKFTSQGSVGLSARTQPSMVNSASDPRCLLQIQITDTGVGIYPEKIHLIFDSFHQLESGLARSYTGLGLGLAIVDKLLRLMGGSIHVESLPGKGSIFSITIPLGVPRMAGAPTPTPAAVRLRKILLVEDNKIAQQVVTYILQRAQYHVTCAGNGKEGLRAATSSAFDLILMDLQLPGMDGFQVVSSIRALPGYQNRPIVALTVNYSEEYRLLCAQSGMQGFLAKPIDREALLLTLEKLLP
ncbi:MAG: response regulator [Acidobacteriia bacterium]|nr:response regulator [Terriglobia bacterium]